VGRWKEEREREREEKGTGWRERHSSSSWMFVDSNDGVGVWSLNSPFAHSFHLRTLLVGDLHSYFVCVCVCVCV